MLSSIKPYIQIARPDHWFKNVFMIPGIGFAIYDSPASISWALLPEFIVAFLALCLIASSNYTINEILDAPKDKLHPVKKYRPVPSGKINIKIGYIQWFVLTAAGLLVGLAVNKYFFVFLALLWIMGLLYNVRPIRLKDLPYLDVLSESLNNPIRLFLGWYLVFQKYPPTLSLVMAYWMIGAFFMATKRFGEYRRIGDKEVAANYRKSFRHYNEYRLMLSMVYYVSALSLFFGIFLVRYRIELILSVPFLAGFIPMYMRMGYWEDSPVQYPEKLYKQRALVIYSSIVLIILLILLFYDMPIIETMFAPKHLPQ